MKLFGRKPLHPSDQDLLHAQLEPHFAVFDESNVSDRPGIYIAKGWVPTLSAVHAQLKSLNPGYQITALGERNGGLQLEIENANDREAAVIRQATKASRTICEHCGRKGRLYDIDNDGFMIVLCLADRLAIILNDAILNLRYRFTVKRRVTRYLKQATR